MQETEAMAVTQDELNDFQLFAAHRLANAGTESMAELVAGWEEHRQHSASVAALPKFNAQAEAGCVDSAAEILADARKTSVSRNRPHQDR